MSVEVLGKVVWINHNGVEIGLPKEVIMSAHDAIKIKDGYGFGKQVEDDVLPMHIVDCPQCGLVPTATGTCGYCGSKCE